MEHDKTMNHHFTYRLGTINDLQQLKDLGLLAYGLIQDRLTPENWQTMETGLKNEERVAQLISISVSYVCLDGDKIVGMAYLMPHGNPTEIYPADWAYIRMVGVHPDYRGRGICKQLMQMVLNQARLSEEKTLGLHTSEVMEDAMHIYEDMGFRKVKDLGPKFGVQYYLYQLDL